MAEIMVRFDDLRRYCEKRHCGSVPLEYIKQMPTIEPKVRHGRWIPIEYDSYADGAPVWDKYECSECGHEHSGEEDTLTAFCPDCGADMSEVLLQAIDNPDEIILYDCDASIVILVCDEQNPLEKNVFPSNMLKFCGDEQGMHLTLAAISRQLLAVGVQGAIMVIYETGLSGTVYRYGNHGPFWERVGLLAGWG